MSQENSKKKQYDCICWDVDGTLLNFLKSEKYSLIKCFNSYGIEIDEEIYKMYSAINISFWERLERKEITKPEVLRGRFVKLFEELHPGGNLENKNIDLKVLDAIKIDEFIATYQRNLGSVYYYQDDSLNLCKKIKQEGFKQYIVTNGVEWTQRNKLRLAGFDLVMDDIFISEVIGYNKPDGRYFEICFDKMRESGVEVDKSRILLVGDSMTADIKGAVNAGIDSCLYHYNTENQKTMDIAPKYYIQNLWEVEQILWQDQQTKN